MIKDKMKRFLLLVSLVAWAFPLSATMILPSKPPSFAKLTNRAEFVFKGICVEQRKEAKANVYYFKVEEVLKGNLKIGETIDIRQRQFYFYTGNRYLLFLGPRQSSGLDTIIGGRFGKFWVREKEGKEVIENPFGLPEELQADQKKGVSKGIDYQDFKEKLKK